MFQTFSGGSSNVITLLPLNMITPEGDTNRTSHFQLLLSAFTTNDISVDYVTSSGTAVAGSDFVSTSGTATITAGTASTNITLTILGDTVFELNERFYIDFSNPVGATLLTNRVYFELQNDDSPDPVRFNRIRRLQFGGPLRLEFNPGQAGAIYQIQASDNVRQWETIGQMTGSTNAFEFTDNASTNRTKRFYRTISQ